MDIICKVCNKKFYVYPYRLKSNPNFCSSKCYGVSKIGHTPWNVGMPISEQARAKISKSLKGRPSPQRMKRDPITCKQCRKVFIPEETRKRTFCSKQCSSLFRKGKPGATKGQKRPNKTGENHHNWKGDSVSYSGLHYWVVSRLGKPDTCVHCKKSGLYGKDINWANKSGDYLRDINDWMRLCVFCHRKYDDQRKVYV